jgi:hypothetical protein
MFEVGDLIKYKYASDTVIVTGVIEEGIYGECINEPAEAADIPGYSSRFIAAINLEHWRKL